MKLSDFKKRSRVSKKGCWLWKGARTGSGYGSVHYAGKTRTVHLLTYVLAKGAIPAGYHVDHVKHRRTTRHCCNPDHLEAVTPHVNTLRGEATRHREGICADCGNPRERAVVCGKSVGGKRKVCTHCEKLRHAAYRKKRKTMTKAKKPAQQFDKDGKPLKLISLFGTKLELTCETHTVIRWRGGLRLGRYYKDCGKTDTRLMVEYFPEQKLWQVRVGDGGIVHAVANFEGAALGAMEKEVHSLRTLLQHNKKAVAVNTKTLEFLKKLKP